MIQIVLIGITEGIHEETAGEVFKENISQYNC